LHDPTASESYIALRNALLAIQDDPSAVHSVLSSRSDGGASWVESAYHELRRSLVQGRLREAESLGRLIATVLDIREQGASDELAENRLHRDAMQFLIDGIGAILAQDNDTGIQLLERLTEAVYCNESLQWVAWLWTAKAACDKGDLPRAKKAASAALALAEHLDPIAEGTNLCTVAEIEFLSGSQEQALQHLSRASRVFDEVGDVRGTATAGLLRARMLGGLQRDDEALAAGRQALAADQDWEDPAVYVSEWLLARERWEEAEAVIQPFAEAEPVAPQIRRQKRLIEVSRLGEIPAPVMRAFLDHKEKVPAEGDLAALRGLSQQCPGFLPLRELLAWNLAKLSHDDEARPLFEALAAEERDPEVRASALLGLGCLANRRFEHRQSSARVRAAASAATVPEAPLLHIATGRQVLSDMGSGELVGALFAGLDGEPLDKILGGGEQARPGAPDRGLLDRGVSAGASAPAEMPTMPIERTAVPARAQPAPASAAPITAPKAVFTGDLQLLAVPDLMEFLKSSRRTGTLVITSSVGIGAVHMRQGMITGAASPHSKNTGKFLLEGGHVTEEQLGQAAEYQRADSPNRLIGSILVERGLVDRETLQQALVRQIKCAVMEMVGWTSGRFAFEPDKRGQADESDVEVELDTQEVLLDVMRQLDEMNRDQAEEPDAIVLDESAVDII